MSNIGARLSKPFLPGLQKPARRGPVLQLPLLLQSGLTDWKEKNLKRGAASLRNQIGNFSAKIIKISFAISSGETLLRLVRRTRIPLVITTGLINFVAVDIKKNQVRKSVSPKPKSEDRFFAIAKIPKKSRGRIQIRYKVRLKDNPKVQPGLLLRWIHQSLASRELK